jgi:hypothetical protein
MQHHGRNFVTAAFGRHRSMRNRGERGTVPNKLHGESRAWVRDSAAPSPPLPRSRVWKGSVPLHNAANPFLVAVARPRVWLSRIVTLAPKSKVLAQRPPPATRIDLLTIDRIRDPPAPHERKDHADCSPTPLNWQRFVFHALKWTPRYRVFVKSPILPKYRPRIRLRP